MWFERFVIIVTSLHRDYLPSSWAMFSPTIIDVGVYVGTLGLFFTLFLLFAKYFPVINMFEVKTILKSSSCVAHHTHHNSMHAIDPKHTNHPKHD
jgi:molybdopterin-containing oxidoreductase family membrane subunit